MELLREGLFSLKNKQTGKRRWAVPNLWVNPQGWNPRISPKGVTFPGRERPGRPGPERSGQERRVGPAQLDLPEEEEEEER